MSATEQIVQRVYDGDGNLVSETLLTVPRELPSREESAALAARLAVVDMVRAGELDDDTVAQLVGLFPAWDVGLTVKAGEVYAWDGTLVEVVQPHTTQSDWTPDVVPALFRIHRTPDMTEWVAGISVEVGERFTYLGATYEVVQAHTTQTGWEPPAVPALWSLVV